MGLDDPLVIRYMRWMGLWPDVGDNTGFNGLLQGNFGYSQFYKKDVTEVIETIRALRGRFPLFGICLGHQLIALAYGAKTYKLKFGHRGGNHPVMNLETGKIEMTSQNHSYAVDEGSLAGTDLTVTHRNLLDGTVEGQKCAADRVFSVQYHPESAPGPQDSAYLFAEFLQSMKEAKEHAETH